ncbi:UDP-N-acetylmuramoyl-tripeptide--D-alanyl-D-alanine ligase [Pseudoalteromonas sp. MMG010]|uniref:UDP-N-acetylmuramoyl-tripeptide--D-alanyl-D- alanine ligase n=1 Tax=Pseudoalteromonas sp. MMG010 TaxID=2822685 RepID=UPI001B3A16B8|nr:UDP-N-acetylmuramoyl-tripeptide--D-alanyl-D-alanine ligase [Pseudoalteromonas sp. MMG010]MBQ4833851.1 UDP-N-acetylmuramoyl-tripeptide--D-alanyl-D-alanine ligase [Pseudoalteromonas sp. MMG010]
MIPMDFDWLASVLKTDYKGANQAVLNINTDTRTVSSGDVFLALQGPNFDGHQFVQQAKDKGAVAAIVSEKLNIDLPQFLVSDTRIALGEIAAAVKAEVNPKTIAITGSVGKTTVKEMCAAILSAHGNVLATKGNFNNDIGVPLTLLRLTPEHRYAVIELGANHIGEIAYTTSLTKPDVAVVCNVGEAHLEGFGSVAGVAKAKGEIFSGLKPQGVGVVNCDSEFSSMWLNTLNEHKVKRFSNTEKLDVWAEDIVLDDFAQARFMLCTAAQKVPVKLALPGKHNVTNALIATALTLEFDVPLNHIANALETMPYVAGRVNLIPVNQYFTVIDDTYNANVKSVKAAIDLLCDTPGKRILVLGDMGELGDDAASYHEEVGEYALQQGLDALYTVGELSRYASDVFNTANRHFSQRNDLSKALMCELQQASLCKTTVLVKGSRSSRMELLVTDLVSGQQHAINGVSQC